MKLKPKRNLYTLLCALLCCVMFTGLLPTTALADENATLTDGWTQCGTCEWKIDDDGVLTIRPLGDGSEGTLASWSWLDNSPWTDNATIKSVVVKSGVKASTCRHMFSGCENLTSLDLSGLDTSNVTDIGFMFSWCKNLTSLDLSGFDTSNVTDMDSMFYECNKLTSLDLSNFDTSNVTKVSYMFHNCNRLTSLDLSSFDTSNIPSMYSMFYKCSALKELTLGANFNFKNSSDLPNPSDAAPYTGKWTNGALSLTADELTEQYDGSAMAGTWVWETEQATLTDGWTQCGTCEWKIDGDGVLTIRPLGNGSEGTLEDWGTGNSPWYSNSNITSVVVKSGVKAATCRGMFYRCEKITTADLSGFDTSNVTDMRCMFSFCSALTSLDLSSFDTSNVTDMSSMFYWCFALTCLDLSSFDTSNVTDMSWMFGPFLKLTSLDLSNFDTSNVTDMRGMFTGVEKLTSLDLSNLDTSNVTNMDSMFYACNALTSLDLSSFDTSNVTDMYRMFGICLALTSLDLSNFDTSNVTNMDSMFEGCDALTSLDLSSFDTRSVTDMDNMFNKCSALKELTLGTDFNFKSNNCFPKHTGKWTNGVLSLTADELTYQYNGSDMAGTWVCDTGLTDGWTQCGTCEWKIDDGVLTIRPMGDGIKGTLEDWDTDNSPWTDNTTIKSVIVKSGVKAATCAYMFSGCRNITSLNLNGLDTCNVTDMHSMFNECSALTSLNLSRLDTRSVTDMDNMFNECSALKELTLGTNFNFKSTDTSLPDPSDTAPYTGRWTNGALSLTADELTEHYKGFAMISTWVWEIDQSILTDGWWQSGTCEWKIDDGVLTIRPMGDSSEGTLEDWWDFATLPWYDYNSDITSVVVKSGVKAATCYSMFRGCNALTSLDLSGLDTSNVTNMRFMFNECSALTSLDLSGFDTSNVTDMSLMFKNCSALTSLDLSGFDTSNVTTMQSMFNGCSSLTSLDLSSFDTSNVTYMYNMFNKCSALKKLTLGAYFNFKSTDTSLPNPSDTAPYTGKWTNGALSLTADELTKQYNGSAMAGTWVWEEAQNTDEDDQPHTDFAPAQDGSWYVYINGEINISVDKTLHFYNNAFFWIEKGKWNNRKHSFVDYSGAKFLVANGQVALEQNGLTQDPENADIWYFCAGGQIQAQANGLVMYQDEWFNVQDGKLDTTFAGYVDYDGSKFLVAAGRICKEADGLLVQDPQNPANWYYVAGGQVATAYTGLALHSDQKHWFYIENGKLNAGYTGPVEYNGQIFEVINGALPVPGEN